MVTTPVSSGWRSTSRLRRWNSGSSSRKSTLLRSFPILREIRRTKNLSGRAIERTDWRLTMSKQPREAIAVGRFSTDKQDEGDSIRRQQNSFARVCQRWELQPSTRWTIFDKGLSGFTGDHLSEKAE